MNILFLGPQGSGKGTQAKLLSDKLGYFYFESGDFLRQLANKNEVVRKMMDDGELLPSEEFASYVQAFFDEKGIYDNIIFDGFPREIEQYKFFKQWLDEKEIKFDFAIVLEVSEKVTLERLEKREREDDTTDAINKRLELYKTETLPLIQELENEIKVIHIDGERTIQEIFKNIWEKLH